MTLYRHWDFNHIWRHLLRPFQRGINVFKVPKVTWNRRLVDVIWFTGFISDQRYYKYDNIIQPNFSKRKTKKFWSISLVRILQNVLKENFWNRIHISDSCGSFEKSKDFEYLKTCLKTMPISRHDTKWISPFKTLV